MEQNEFQEKLDALENKDIDNYTFDISNSDIKLSKEYIDFMRLAIEEKKEFFLFTNLDSDYSIELKIEASEQIFLFRLDGNVVNAKSFYLFDKSDIDDFIEQFE